MSIDDCVVVTLCADQTERLVYGRDGIIRSVLQRTRIRVCIYIHAEINVCILFDSRSVSKLPKDMRKSHS